MDIFILLFSWVSVFLITVCNGAKIGVQPNDVSAIEGDEAKFICLVTDLGNNEVVSWMKGNVKISTGETLRISFEKYKIHVSNDVYTLTIKNVVRDDGGFAYACRVYNGNNVILVSDDAHVEVQEIPADYYPRCEITPSLNYRSGSMVSAVCTAEKTQPVVSLAFKKNGVNINSDLSISSNMVTLKHIFTANENNDGDVFTCVMRSSVKNLQRNCTTSPLVHNYIPIVNIQGSDTMDKGREAIFICTSNAVPKETDFIWSFSREIDSSRYDISSQQILRITDPEEDLAGTVIKCTVRNSIGESSDEITIVSLKYIKNGVVTTPSTPTNLNNSQTIKTGILSPPRVGTSSDPDKWHENIATVAIIAGLALIIFLLLALLPIVCIKYFRKNSNSGYSQARAESETYGFSDSRVRPQPIMIPLPIEEEPPQWTRTIGTQVTEEDVAEPVVEVPTTDPIYIEIPPDRYIYSSASL